MKKKIITDIKYLKQKSSPIHVTDARMMGKNTLKDIIKDLEDSLQGQKGIGLAAIQIGIPLQVGIIRIGDKKIDLINPKILEKNEKFRYTREGCLSIPGLYVDTIRYKDITVENNGEKYSLYGVEAVCFQHEVDHMKGTLMLNRKWRKRK